MTTDETATGASERLFDWRAFLLFQLAGLFFLLFYYSELVLVTLNGLVPDLPARETVNTGFLAIYGLSNAIQKALVGQYAALLLLGLASIALVFVLLVATSLRRLDIQVTLRGVFFLVLGTLAIPAILWLWSLRWLPGAIGGFFMMVYGAIAGFLQPIVFFVAPLVGMVIAYSMIVSALAWLLRRGWFGPVFAVVLLSACTALLLVDGLLETVIAWIDAIGAFLNMILSFPLMAATVAISFSITAISFAVAGVVIGSIVLLVVSQFGHMFIDTLFDASNVRKDARAAGRFLVGIGFLCATILLCFAENQFARVGAGNALETLHAYFGLRLDQAAALGQVSAWSGIYLGLLPGDMQGPVATAFSYGYPPSLELILLVIACWIAVVLIGRHLFIKPHGGDLPIAFAPRELFFLLVGAALVLLFAFAAAARGSSSG